MRIGILTFHWATNYGAVLQSFALQTYLVSIGHEVIIIDYKPKRYNRNLMSLLRSIKNKQIAEYFESLKKEKSLKIFRGKYLNKTRRVYSFDQLSPISKDFDCIISGSDQVMNPYFLMSGDENGKITPSYYLGFPFDGKRVAYAVSFGCVSYPDNARNVAAKYINSFEKIGVRETSGIDIVKKMGYDNPVLVPDPTILLDSCFYKKLADSISFSFSDTFIYCFFIRHIPERRFSIKSLQINYSTIWNNEDGDYSLECWLVKIRSAKFVITDSFHCVVMCLKIHVPFAVITEQDGNVGMNDRLYTLLGMMTLENRIIYKKNINDIIPLIDKHIDWEIVDEYMYRYKQNGVEFLRDNN